VNRTRRALGLAAAATGIAAALDAGYAAGGPAGLIDAAAVACVGVLIVARGTVPGRKPEPVRPKDLPRDRPPAVRTADFPAYRTIASDLEWAQLSRRHYQHALRPRLTRLAVALGRLEAVPADLADAAGDLDGPDGPGPDLATLDRIVGRLEER
jgi:hypothetical protein